MWVVVENLGFKYVNKKLDRSIFNSVSVSFRGGRFYALMGPSGSGKTTLFRLLTRELEPTEGRILVDGQDLVGIPVRELRSSVVGQIFQDYLLIPFLTPVENLMLAREIAVGSAGREDADRAVELLRRVGLDDQINRPVESLSGGEKQRVAIARALMGAAGILLADEPTGALDADNTRQVAQLLADLAHDEGILVIAGTRDPEFARYADSVVRIREHQLQEE